MVSTIMTGRHPNIQIKKHTLPKIVRWIKNIKKKLPVIER